jgi:hypothetical protein
MAVAAVAVVGLSCKTRTSHGGPEPGRASTTQRVETPFRIIATDSGFIAPSNILAGLRHIIFENRGTQIHEAMLVKLPQGMTPADYVAAVKTGDLFPRGALDYSGPGLTSPGESTELWVPVDPGRYILICWNNGHAKSAPVHPFTVQDLRADDAAPKEDLVIRLVDYRFELGGSLKSGVRTIRVETPGPSMHEADLFRLLAGRTAEDVRLWRKSNSGAAPAQALGGILDSHDIARVVWLRRLFSPGRYALHCAMSMTPSASTTPTELTHADLGMVRELDVNPSKHN